MPMQPRTTRTRGTDPRRLPGTVAGPNASRNAALVDEVKVVDERAREVIKDLLRRMDQVEQTLEITPDPFA